MIISHVTKIFSKINNKKKFVNQKYHLKTVELIKWREIFKKLLSIADLISVQRFNTNKMVNTNKSFYFVPWVWKNQQHRPKIKYESNDDGCSMTALWWSVSEQSQLYSIKTKYKHDESRELKSQEIKISIFKFLSKFCPPFHLFSNTCSITAMEVGGNSTLCNCLFYTCKSTRGRTGIAGAFQVLHYRAAAFLSLCPMTERLKIPLLLLISEIG